MDDYSYLGSGKLLIREYGVDAPFEEVGNVSALTFSPQVNSLTLTDYQVPGGGTRNRVDRVTEVQCAYTFHDFNGANFARSMRGSVSAVAGGTATEEAAVAYPGGFTPLAYIATAITEVTSPDGEDTYVSGTDYELADGGLRLPAGSTIPAPVGGVPNVAVSYSYAAAERVQAFVASAKKYEALFLGLNEARSGKPVRIRVHKLSGGVLQELGLLGDQYGQGQVQGALEADTSKGVGLSQYFVADIVK